MRGKGSKVEIHPNWYKDVEGMCALILGTFPPLENKREYDFYYPNSQNHFWKILAKLANKKILKTEGDEAVTERLELMKYFKVGVQNLGKVIERIEDDSADRNLVFKEFQDLKSIIEKHKTLKVIHLTGYTGKSSTYHGFISYLKEQNMKFSGLPRSPKAGESFLIECGRPIRCIVGNSTSTAAARKVKFDDLVEQFRKTLEDAKKAS